ncbi:DUF3616 domain-containing protein [Chthonobacter rhizosphaerae]|uniref:DUF3616 domain-containing protein n=1 Tax=Chthonobacter rhizosphaerae TaxID=2735553 RepID=UPI0015EF273D|nr:DUF3616 domain-containing protein [Chthonobacter rhizosphaerae]
MPAATPTRQIDLVFSDWRPLRHVDDPLHKDLSAVALVGDTLFVACDETASVERLRRTGDGSFGDHKHVPLDDLVRLPAGGDGEMDIEGLCASDGYLWILGSHAAKRCKPEVEKHGREKAMKRMRATEREPNRSFLGRVPLVEEGAGLWRLVEADGDRRAAWLKVGRRRSRLLRWIAEDDHLAPFLDIPSKENGFDAEGLAVRGDRVWVGLRGPVLRGHAVVLDLQLTEGRKGHLKGRRVDGARHFHKHLIDTRGLGIRDMRLCGDDMLLLVGPTMSLDGQAYVIRWRGVTEDDASGVVPPDRIEVLAELPYEHDTDHPEGLDLWPDPERRSLIVLYDAPGPERADPDRFTVKADVFTLPA